MSGQQLAVRSVGSGRTSVMLVSGYGQTLLQAWSSVQDRLGVGDSEPPSGTRTFADLADELDAVITALDLARPIVLVAHSLGAPVAMTWAAHHQQDVVLLDGSDGSFHEAVRAAADDALAAGSANPDVLAVKGFLEGFEDPSTNLEGVDLRAAYAALDPLPRVGPVPVVVQVVRSLLAGAAG